MSEGKVTVDYSRMVKNLLDESDKLIGFHGAAPVQGMLTQAAGAFAVAAALREVSEAIRARAAQQVADEGREGQG
jgi:hypothetical protein